MYLIYCFFINLRRFLLANIDFLLLVITKNLCCFVYFLVLGGVFFFCFWGNFCFFVLFFLFFFSCGKKGKHLGMSVWKSDSDKL